MTIVTVGGTPVSIGGSALSLPKRLPRISVQGNNFMRLGQPIKAWGYNIFDDYVSDELGFANEETNTAMAAITVGNVLQGANIQRMHLNLWHFIEGPDKDNLTPVQAQIDYLINQLDVGRENGMYFLLDGLLTWYPDRDVPEWYDTDLTYLERWDIMEYWWQTIVQAIVDSGNATTVWGYDILGEPMWSTNPAAPWNGPETYPGTGIHLNQNVARGAEVDDDTGRAWLTKMITAIKGIDPDALCCFGSFGDFAAAGINRIDNVKDLVDFLQPHLYIRTEPANDIAWHIARHDTWFVGHNLPVMIGESNAFNTEEINRGVIQDMVDRFQGIITFSFGYPPSRYTTPPTPPRYPADPNTWGLAYAFQQYSHSLFNEYITEFMGA